jgi:hypothetical protein
VNEIITELQKYRVEMKIKRNMENFEASTGIKFPNPRRVTQFDSTTYSKMFFSGLSGFLRHFYKFHTINKHL